MQHGIIYIIISIKIKIKNSDIVFEYKKEY